MPEYVENNYNESGYIDGDESTTPEPSNCDLSSVLNEISLLKSQQSNTISILNSFTLKFNEILSRLSVSHNSILELINGVTHISDISLDTNSSISSIVPQINLLSLNGNGSEYKDGVSVTVSGRSTVYAVERSFVSLYSDNGYTVHYDLISEDGYKCTVPEALLTKV